jgi:hypothetical protein
LLVHRLFSPIGMAYNPGPLSELFMNYTSVYEFSPTTIRYKDRIPELKLEKFAMSFFISFNVLIM